MISFCLGFLRARIRFSKPPGEALSLLILSESTASMALDHTGKIYLSYKQPIAKA